MKIEKLLDNKLNIQLFAGPGEAGGGGEGSTQTTVEETIPPVTETQTTTETTQPPAPQENWETIKPENFKNIAPENITEFIEQAKKNGISAAVALHQLSTREKYLATERDSMTPELRALDPIIENFIASEENQEYVDVIARLAENAQGRKFLQEKILRTAEGGYNGMDKGGLAGITKEEFTTRYNEAFKAQKGGDSTKMKELENFARSSEDPYYKDFLMLDK